MKKPIVGFIAGVTAPPGKRMGHAGALISGGADTADAKLAIMEECGFTVTRNPSEMGKLLKALRLSIASAAALLRKPWKHSTLGRRSGAPFWTAIIVANIILSGDNAVVIAMAARSLPPQQQRKAIFWGSARGDRDADRADDGRRPDAALPYLKIVGGLLLLWIGVQLLLDEDEERGRGQGAARMVRGDPHHPRSPTW